MPRADQPFRSQIVGAALARVRAAGGDVDGLLHAFGLPKAAESEREVVVQLDQFHALTDALAAAARDPFLGLHIGTALERGVQGLFEFSCLSAPTIGASLERVVRYMGLLNDLVKVTLAERGSEAMVKHWIPGEPLGAGRHANEFFVTCVIARARNAAPFPLRARWPRWRSRR